MIIAGNKIYKNCPDCEQLIQINKFLIGSLHICLTDEELEQKQDYLKYRKSQSREHTSKAE